MFIYIFELFFYIKIGVVAYVSVPRGAFKIRSLSFFRVIAFFARRKNPTPVETDRTFLLLCVYYIYSIYYEHSGAVLFILFF